MPICSRNPKTIGLFQTMNFWEGKRVLVTGGSGFLGSLLFENYKPAIPGGSIHSTPQRLRPRSEEPALPECTRIRNLILFCIWRAMSAGSGPIGQIPVVLLRQSDDGHADDGVCPAGRFEVCRGSAPSAPIPNTLRFHSKKKISGTDIRKKRTLRTALRRKCCWSRHRHTGTNTDSIRSFCFR